MTPSLIQFIELENLVPHPNNPRDDLGDQQKLVELANDIAANGNTALLRVVPIESGQDKGKFLLIEGHRRTAAARLGNVDALQCIVDPSCDTLAKQIEFMLRENTHREGITPSNEAKAIQTLLDCPGMNVRKVAKVVHRSESFIRQRSRLAHMPPVAHHLVDGGSLTLEQSEAFDEFKDDEDAYQELILTSTSPNLSPNQFDYLVRKLRDRRDAPAKKEAAAKLIKELAVTELTRQQTYTGPFNRDFKSGELTDAEHANKGHLAFVNENSGNIEWYVKREATPGQPKVKLTEEEVEEKRKLKDLEAGLEIDLAIWDEFLAKAVKDAGGGIPLTPAEKILRAGMSVGLLGSTRDYERAGQILLARSDGWKIPEAILSEVAKLRPLQLVMLRVVLGFTPERLHKPSTWDTKPFPWGGQETDINRWIRIRREVFGYAPSACEQEAIDHFAALKATASEEDADSDTCDVDDCNNTLDDGKGYDGKCGTCADKEATDDDAE